MDRQEAIKRLKENTSAFGLMERANGHCELCHQPYDLLVMHHNDMVKDAPEKIFDPANVFAVCYTCHADIHPWLR